MCVVGRQGSELRIEVRGWTPWKACDALKAATDAPMYEADTSDAPVVCRYELGDLIYTVRDRGLLVLYGNAFCDRLRTSL